MTKYTSVKYEEMARVLGEFLTLHSLAKDITYEKNKKYYDEQYPKFVSQVKKIDDTMGRKLLEVCYKYIRDTHPDSPHRIVKKKEIPITPNYPGVKCRHCGTVMTGKEEVMGNTKKMIGLLSDMKHEYSKSIGWCNLSDELYDAIEDAVKVNLQEQIDELAGFIIAEVPGEPSLSEGAVDTAIRVIRKYQKESK